MQNEPQPSVKRIYARICIIIGILGIACTYSPLILPVPWKTETKVLLVVIGGILILCSLVIKFHLLRCPYCGWGGLLPHRRLPSKRSVRRGWAAPWTHRSA